MEGVRAAVDQIAAAVRSQIQACEEVAASIGSVAEGTSAHETTAQRMGAATHMLREHANRLRQEVERFRVS